MVRVEDHTDLAWYFTNTSNKKNIKGVEVDDIYQAALIGIWLASQSYDEEEGSFPTYCYKFVQGEINNMVYKSTTENGKPLRLPRFSEETLEDIEEEHDSYSDDDLLSFSFIEKYLSTLQLSEPDKIMFYDMIKYGEREAVNNYRILGHSKSSAYKTRDRVRRLAKRHMESLS